MIRASIGARASERTGGVIIAIVGLAAAACTEAPNETTDEDAVISSVVGLAVEVENGVAKPLSVKAGQTFYLNQIDFRTSITTTFDEGVDGLRTRGDFAELHWDGIRKEEQEPVLLSNADGTFTRRRFYRDAAWMTVRSTFVLEQLDSHGHVIGTPITADAGLEDHRSDNDSFWDRRIRAIQWTRDCKTLTDCTGAINYEEEALVELRLAMHPEQTFRVLPAATALRLRWSEHAPYTIPLTQVASPPFAYGFAIDVDAVTPPRADGTYAPGSDITFRVTLRDGAGNRLHPPGALPSYNDVLLGPDVAGIKYYNAFFDPTTTYWRRKHRERMMMAEFIGPAQQAQPIRTIIDLDKFLNADDVQVTGTLAADGVHAEFHTFPTAHDLFGGAFDPAHAAWANPVSDTWTHHVPADAPAGTYFLTIKGRRVYMGEDIPFTRTLEVQVGTPVHTEPTLNTGGCNACHSGPSSLGIVLHANANRGTCAGCHVPLGFELEGPIYVRVHFIHSRSRRFDAPLDECATCHLTRDSIQRTSKSACLSCHRSYPAWHVRAYGPITSIYVGDGRESFQQCTSTCHRTHPHSRL
jgi:hypothetical protein